MKARQSLAHSALNITAGLVALGWATVLSAQTPGKAEVRAVKGTATYSSAARPAATPLKAGATLFSGSTIKTGPGSSVDLFMGKSAGLIRVGENTTFALDKLAYTETGADTVVEVQLNLPDGTISGNVNKLSAASKYEVKVPNGVAGIRGTRYQINSSGYVVLLDGSLIMVYVAPGKEPIPYPMFGPPAQYFSPAEGVKPAPPSLVSDVSRRMPGAEPAPTMAGSGIPDRAIVSPNQNNLPFVPPVASTSPTQTTPPENP